MSQVMKAEVGEELAVRPLCGGLALLDIQSAGARYGTLKGSGDSIAANLEHSSGVQLFAVVRIFPCAISSVFHRLKHCYGT